MNRRSALKLSAGLLRLATFGTGLIAMTYSRLAMSASRQYRLDVQSVDGQPAYNGVAPGLTMRANPGEVIDEHSGFWKPH